MAGAGSVESWIVNEFATFLQMGGHGLYVWLAYGIAWVVLIVLAIRPILSRRRFLAMHAIDRGRKGNCE